MEQTQNSDESQNIETMDQLTLPQTSAQPARQAVFSGLSGNEMYCLDLINYRPGNLLVGNSVFSMGVLGGLRTIGRGLVGGEITAFTEMIKEGRRLSYERLNAELTADDAVGATGLDSELVFHGTNAEFLSVGSGLYAKDGPHQGTAGFTSSFDGQELYSAIDAYYEPKAFVFGNVAYSIGIGRSITGFFRQFVKGEVKQYTEIFNHTRHLALERITEEARSVGANSVVGIQTNIIPYGTTGVQEMVMIGTAAHHELATDLHGSGVTTSDLTAQEMWNIAKMGYMPLQVVLGTSVYSIGFVGGMKSFFKSFIKGEINEMTQLIYGAREESLKKVQADATQLGADDVLGLQTYIYDIGGGLIEFLVIGTAVKKVDGVKTKSDQLPPQAIIRDKNTFTNTAEMNYGVSLNNQRV